MKKQLLIIFALFGLNANGQTQLITNGNFNSSSGWTTSGNWYISSAFSCNNSAPGYAYAGNSSGQAVINETGDLKQTITIPSMATSATFSFYVSASTDEVAISTVYDSVSVFLLNASGGQLMQFTPTNINNLNAGSPVTFCSTYGLKTFPIPSAYFGQPIQIDFKVHSDGGPKNTMFRIDDVSLTYITPGCSYSISPSSNSPTASSGSGSVSVTANAGCPWTAVSNNTSWLTVTSGSSGSGNGTVGYSYTSNGTSSRTGIISIAGQTFTVTQAGTTVSLLYGVDISDNNTPVSLSQVFTTFHSFAYVKATEGTSCSSCVSYFNSEIISPNPYGVVLGAYHYARPDNGSTALDEANYFLSIAGSYIGNGFLPPALDIDGIPANNYLTSHSILQLAQWVNAWAIQVHNSTNIWPVLYCDRCNVAGKLYPSYLNGTINSNIKLWISDPDHPAGSPGNSSSCSSIPWVGWPWVFHQYFFPQMAGNDPTAYADPGMDQDVFNGTITDFNNLIGLGSGCTCPIAGTQFPSITFNPINNWQTATTCQSAGQYSLYNVTSGQTYEWSYCPSDGGYSDQTENLLLNLYNNGTSAYITCNDDACSPNLGPKITWTANFTGVVRVYTTRWNTASNHCDVNSVCGTLVYRCSSCSSILPDLAFQSGTININGNIISLPTTIVDSGAGPSGSTNITFALSTSSNFSPPYTYLPAGTIPALAPLGTNTQTYVFDLCALGIPNGTYYIGFFIDHPYPGIIAESNENNNARFWFSAISSTCVCSPPSNNDCSGISTAIPITVGTSCTPTYFKTCGATSSGYSSCSSMAPEDDDVFFTFQAPSSGAVNIEVHGAIGFYPQFQVLSGPCATTTQVNNGCSTSGTSGGTSSLVVTGLTSGASYFIRVWSAGSGFGSTNNSYICVSNYCPTPSQPGVISGNTTVCQGTSQVYTIASVSGATSYTWTLPFSWSGSSTTTSITTTAGYISDNIIVTANNSCGSGTPRTLAVTANQTPSTPTISPTGPITACSGVSKTLTVISPQTGVTYNWSNGGTGTTHSVINFNGNIYCYGNIGSCNSNNSNTVTINLWPIPSQPGPISGPTSICVGTEGIYSISPVTYATSYQWYLPNNNWYGIYHGDTLNAGANANTGGTLSVYAKNSCGNSPTRTLAITTKPIASTVITSSGPTIFCSSGSDTLKSPLVSGVTYQWKKNGSNISGATASSYLAKSSGTYKVKTTITLTGCSSTTPTGTLVTVNSNPTATITPGGPTTFCAGDSVILNANTGTGLTYQWKKGNSAISGTLPSRTAKSAGTYKVIVTNTNGCTKQSAGVLVTINCRTGDEIGQPGSMELYPNPTNGKVTVRFNSKTNQNCKLLVTDITGRDVWQEQFDAKEGLNEYEFDLNDLSEGVYLIHVKNSDGEMTQRVVID